MLIPRISLRVFLATFILIGIECVAMAMAAQGHVWAVALWLTMTLIKVLIITYGSMSLATTAFTMTLRLFSGGGTKQSPFATVAGPARIDTAPTPFTIANTPSPFGQDSADSPVIPAELATPDASAEKPTGDESNPQTAE